MEIGFPYARNLIVMRTERTDKKSGKTTRDPHYYLIPICFQDEAKARWIFGFWQGANEEHIRRIRDE
jgi:hypothetical protein